MRGMTIPLKLSGLRPDEVGFRNTGALTQAVNARVINKALEYYIPDIMKFPTVTVDSSPVSISMDWPYPQVFQTDTGIFIGTRNHLYKLDWSGGTWSWTDLLAAYTGHDVDWPWTIADFPMNQAFASANVLVYYDRNDSAWITRDKNNGYATGTNWHSDWYQPVSICNFKGQFVCVGSKTTTASPSQSRIIRWSEIGGFRWLGSTATAMRNEAGYMFADVDDDEILLRCLPHKRGVIVYGTFHTIALLPVSDIKFDPPVVTFSPQLLIPTGISNPLAVGGWDDMHAMVDRRGRLWTIDVDLKVQLLGYEEFLYPLVMNCSPTGKVGMCSVVYNKAEREFYISDGRYSYLLNEGGLTQISRCISGILDVKEARLVR